MAMSLKSFARAKFEPMWEKIPASFRENNEWMDRAREVWPVIVLGTAALRFDDETLTARTREHGDTAGTGQFESLFDLVENLRVQVTAYNALASLLEAAEMRLLVVAARLGLGGRRA